MELRLKKSTYRYDPYKNYKFRIMMDKRIVLGVKKVSALKSSTETVKYQKSRKDNTLHKLSSRITCEGITLEKGVTHDMEFQNWTNMVHSHADDTSTNLIDFKKELILEILNEKGSIIHKYFLHGCWVSKYAAMPGLDISPNAVFIQNMKLEMDSWERNS